MGQDEWKFLKSIPSHGTKQFLKVSRGIPWDEYFLQNFDFIMNSITVFVIDGSLANPGRKIRLSDPIGKLSDSAGTHRKLTESLVSDSNSFLSVVVKCRNSVVPTLSDIRQLPIGIWCQGFRQLPTGSCRNYWDSMGRLRSGISTDTSEI